MSARRADGGRGSSTAASAPRPAVVAVVGSLNIDLIAQVAHLPRPGQTVPGVSLIERFGGKGANQAVAAAKQGARVSLIGCVGGDEMGRRYRAHLQRVGVDDEGVRTVAKATTGVALIAVDDAAQNTIIVAAGANGRLRPGDVRMYGSRIAGAGALLVQWEVPPAAIGEALQLAARAGVPAIVNASPIRVGVAWGRSPIHTVIVNDDEARALFGPGGRDGLAWRTALRARRVSRLVVTRGAAPTWYLTARDRVAIPTLPVTPRDTVGAGDAFAGTYATGIASGLDEVEAIRQANAAGALATLASGAQEATPTRRAVQRALAAAVSAVRR